MEASKHFTFAKNGKVDNAAQRVFSSDRSSTALSLKERVIHLITGLALALPVVNHLTYFVLSKLSCLMNNPASRTDSVGADIPEGRIRFGGVRAREFHRDAAPEAVGLIRSIELPLRRTV